ncbi:MAG: DNA polymerase III subunit alpha, partial [Gammaproteobacteria bacterium]|nr:DNA polymerase III subunit alpha [Gammaproteobacteria bacterium]
AGLPLVASNEVRFLTPDDFDAHEARTCIYQSMALDDNRRDKVYTRDQYFRSSDEMVELFRDLPEALENTVEIAKRCSLTLELGKDYLPNYEIEDGRSPNEYLADESRRLLALKLKELAKSPAHTPRPASEYQARLETELQVIVDMGFPGYFLIVADFIRWARENGVPVGPGRGSGAGSLVAFVLGITDIDPLEYALLFERFLNPERISMPDFDIDFCMDGRDRVIEYVAQRYGREKVSQIITYGTMAAKAVVRDAARVLGLPYMVGDRISKMIPPDVGMTLAKAFDSEAELGEVYRSDDEARAVLDLARQLEGLKRNAGTHAGGVVIAPSELTDFVPLYTTDADASPVTQFDKDDVEAAGLVKFDFLGLRTLTIIDWAVKTINIERECKGESALDIRLLPLDDAKTFALLKSAHTTSVFQLESRGMQDLIKRLQPDEFTDIIALVALFRPGPLESGMVDDFIQRKHSKSGQPIDYMHPDLEPVLEDTYGVIVYQEQVMQIAQKLAGYTLGGADMLRRAMGKKKPEEMAKQREIFMAGAQDQKVDAAKAKEIFDLMEKFAAYGFNKSHSAAYALLAYQTAWLKAHHPAAFMAAVLSADMDNTDKLEFIQRECKSMQLQILAPDINKSLTAFSVPGDMQIRYGLGALKGLGKNVADTIVELRNEDGGFVSLEDFCLRVSTQKVNKRAMEALINSGAFDAFGPNRPSILAALPVALDKAEQELRDREAGQNDMFGDMADPVIAEAAAIRKLPEWGFSELLAAERQALGLYLSGHPLDLYRSELSYVSSDKIANVLAEKKPDLAEGGGYRRKGKKVEVVGLITDFRKRGNRVTMFLDDGEARIELQMFRESFDNLKHLIENYKIRKIEGELRWDDFIDGWRIAVSDMADIDRVVENRAIGLVINWDDTAMGKIDAAQLQGLLEPYRPGRCQVAVNYKTQRAVARVQLGDSWCVRPTAELRDRLTATFGLHGFVFYGDKNHLAAA